MASLRDIKQRIKSVKNTQQITRAMKMVSAAKLRRAQDRALSFRDYARELSGVCARLTALGAAEGHPADVMDLSFSDQAIAAEWIVENAESLEPKVYRLPDELDAEVARMKLESMGGSLEPLTDEQSNYLSSWEHGT